MVLLIGVAIGLLGGLVRATLQKIPYQPYALRLVWLVVIAAAGQWLAFSFPPTRSNLPDMAIRLLLVLSQLVLLAFVWLNRDVPGLKLLGYGLALNLLVIALNGGLMPISPETAQWLLPELPPESLQTGARVGFSKDILLPRGEARLWFLSDTLRSPAGWSYRVAFSIGDVLVALGAFYLFWSMGGRERTGLLQEKNHVTNNLPPFE
jgi:hypothetical protein